MSAALVPMDDAEPRLASAVRYFDERHVLEHFSRSCGPKYHATRVIPAGPPQAAALNIRSGSDMILRYERRRGPSTGNLFDLELPPSLDPSDRSAKESLIGLLKREFRQWTRILAGGGLKRVNVIPVWHGASGDAIKSIAEYGFAALADIRGDDPGFFAHGRYTTLEAAYACFYATDYPEPKAPNAHGEFSVLLSAAVIGVAYPITPGRHDFPHGPLPPVDADQCRFYGTPFQPPCDTHVAGVSWPDFLATDPGKAQYHELVSSQDAQLVPIASVLFTKGGAAPKAPSIPVVPVTQPSVHAVKATRGRAIDWSSFLSKESARTGILKWCVRVDAASFVFGIAPTTKRDPHFDLEAGHLLHLMTSTTSTSCPHPVRADLKGKYVEVVADMDRRRGTFSVGASPEAMGAVHEEAFAFDEAVLYICHFSGHFQLV